MVETTDQHRTYKVSAADCSHARIALELAVRHLPDVWDGEQREAIRRVHDALGELRELLAIAEVFKQLESDGQSAPSSEGEPKVVGLMRALEDSIAEAKRRAAEKQAAASPEPATTEEASDDG